MTDKTTQILPIFAINGLAHCRSATKFTIKGCEGIRLHKVKIECDGKSITMDEDEFLALAKAIRDAPSGPLVESGQEIYLPTNKKD